jgi:hypothetical protein
MRISRRQARARHRRALHAQLEPGARGDQDHLRPRRLPRRLVRAATFVRGKTTGAIDAVGDKATSEGVDLGAVATFFARHTNGFAWSASSSPS